MTKAKKQTPHVENYFGGCPECGGSDGYTNIGRTHWFVCDEHKTKWCVGSNLFSSWREETEADWRKNHIRILAYREVEPLPPTRTEEEERLHQEWEREEEKIRAMDKGYGIITGPGGWRAVEPGENPLELLLDGAGSYLH